MASTSRCLLSVFLAALILIPTLPLTAEEQTPVSFYNQIRPILQANCHGCHQPAFNNGAYVMTDFESLKRGGETQSAAVVAGKPEESNLLTQITPADGEAAMPKGKKPLSPAEIDLVKRWIAEGAIDDTPELAKRTFDAEHPPIYTRPPVLGSMDFSPDGQLLAIAGFHEVLLMKADGSELVSRLIGVSERIESVRFSPDGKRLLVTGGLPCRMGEIQIWDVAERKLVLSVPATYDTVYGGSWSPDGKLVAFGCADNGLRAISTETGEQVLFQGAHNDWVLDTVFSHDGSHLMSVGRDMTAKLTEVATERFIDNITSITPGALKGGINAVVRHPERDEIVVGGSDGVVKMYRVFRLTARRIGDDANLIRVMPAMRGRVFDVDLSGDGKRVAAVSSLDGAGQLHIYDYEFDTALPENIKAIQSKTVQQRKPEEQEQLDAYHRNNVKLVAQAEFPNSAMFGVSFLPDGKQVAVGGADGVVRLINADTGEIQKEFAPAPLTEAAMVAQAFGATSSISFQEAPVTESLPGGAQVVELAVEPAAIELHGEFDYTQLLVMAKLNTGDLVDVTRMTTFEVSGPIVEVSPSGYISAKSDGSGTLVARVGDHVAQVAVNVGGIGAAFQADFIRDVNPVMSRLGCNQGTCHGSAQGKNGFKLSLRGYDPIFDIRALTDDLASRRSNVASPDDSLMLLKATGAVPHVGGQLVRGGEPYYRILRNWLAGGAKLDLNVPRVTSLEVFPKNPVIQLIDAKQQIRVVATYADGRRRDVTREAFIESGNTEVATVNRMALMTSVRRGEAPVLARFEGSYAATTLTVMGDRTGFEWKDPEKWSPIDEFVAAKWQRMKIEPSEVCTDAEFIRRVYIDLTGLPPTADDVRAFLADAREMRVKRDELVDKLIGSDDFIEYWTNKWADLLQVNSKFLGAEGAKAFRDWIRGEVAANIPYNDFARKIITADGSNKDNPAASYYKILRQPEDIMENTTHLFLAVRFNCNKCHDHPFERWTQDQYYETAAYFARVSLKADPASGDRKIGGTAVEGAKPFYEIVSESEQGEVTHNRTGQVAPPEFPYDCTYTPPEKPTRRQELAAWITSADNQYFAKSYVNRLWGYMFGIGIMEPIDDIRAGNPPSNPELLEHLTKEFISSGFNVRQAMASICKSRTYQLSIETNSWNADDKQNYSHAIARRLPAEVLYDAIHRVTGSQSKLPGLAPGTRAASLPDSESNLTDGFLTNLGRPPRESACECERVNDLQLGPVMALIAGPTVGNAISDEQNEIAKLAASEMDDAKLVGELFLRILNRPANEQEIGAILSSLQRIDTDHQSLQQAVTEREAWWTAEKPKLEQSREAAIATATADLAAYQQQIAPRIEQEEKARQEKVAQTEADLKQYTDALPQNLEAWEKKYATQIEWHPLEVSALDATKGISLSRLDDRSIRATGDAEKGTYTLELKTQLRGITGLRLEALPVEGLAGGGPGLPGNGNFVVTEFEVQAAPLSKPTEMKKVELHNPQADFAQETFNIAQAIDGNANDQQGWAVSPAMGVVHWATFETKQAAGYDEGTIFKIVVHQNHNAKQHLLARFRISATTATAPIGLSLPETLKAVVATEAKQRNEQQTTLLSAYFQKTDTQLAQKQQAVAVAKQPLPEDPGVTSRKDTLTIVSRPVPDDARLAQLRKDMEFSVKQTANRRLTAAQDVAWALINNPAFLFNR